MASGLQQGAILTNQPKTTTFKFDVPGNLYLRDSERRIELRRRHRKQKQAITLMGIVTAAGFQALDTASVALLGVSALSGWSLIAILLTLLVLVGKDWLDERCCATEAGWYQTEIAAAAARLGVEQGRPQVYSATSYRI